MKTAFAPRGCMIGIRTRLMAALMLVLAVVLALLFAWFNQYISRQIWAHLSEDALSILNGALKGIDGDEFEALVSDMSASQADWQDGYPADERFWRHTRWLLTVHQIDPRMYLYTYIAGSQPDEVLFIGSHGAALNPTEGARPFESYQAALLRAGLNGPSSSAPALETPDAYGTWALTVCAPIRNSRGQVVGALGLDLKSDILNHILERTRNGLIVTFLAALLIVFVVLYSMTTRIVQPILRLTEVARRAGEGDYAQDLSGLIPAGPRDEVGTLAQVFDQMLDQLHEREAGRNPPQNITVEFDRDEAAQAAEALAAADEFARALQAARSVRQQPPDGPGPVKNDVNLT